MSRVIGFCWACFLGFNGRLQLKWTCYRRWRRSVPLLRSGWNLVNGRCQPRTERILSQYFFSKPHPKPLRLQYYRRLWVFELRESWTRKKLFARLRRNTSKINYRPFTWAIASAWGSKSKKAAKNGYSPTKAPSSPNAMAALTKPLPCGKFSKGLA